MRALEMAFLRIVGVTGRRLLTEGQQRIRAASYPLIPVTASELAHSSGATSTKRRHATAANAGGDVIPVP